MSDKNWQININWKNKDTCVFYDNQPSSIHVLMSVCNKWFGWQNNYRLEVFKEYVSDTNSLIVYSRIHPEGIDMLEVEYTLLPEKAKKED